VATKASESLRNIVVSSGLGALVEAWSRSWAPELKTGLPEHLCEAALRSAGKTLGLSG
jgi:hypothetical protein